MELKGKEKLKGVNAKLVEVITEAFNRYPKFIITEGLRTAARQKYLVETGKSQTMKSRHLIGQAVDIACLKDDGSIDWNLAAYKAANVVIQKVAKEKGITITWGGTWKSIVDGPHFQIEP